MDDQHLARARGGVGVHLLSLGIWLQQALWPPSHGARGEPRACAGTCHARHGTVAAKQQSTSQPMTGMTVIRFVMTVSAQ